MTRATLSSAENPLRIAELPVGPGTIGVTFLPGKRQADGMTARHKRDLGADLDVVAAWNAACVVTLVEAHELERYGVADLGEQVRMRHMEWHHWPIADFQAPDRAFDAAWPARSAMLRSLLTRGGRVLVHCKGGLGPTPMQRATGRWGRCSGLRWAMRLARPSSSARSRAGRC